MDYGKLIQLSLEEDKQRGLEFTSDWFHGGIKYDFDANVKLDKNKPLNILEIGAFEGKSTVWLIDTYLSHLKSRITVVDPYLTTDTTTNVIDKTFDLFKKNIKLSKYPSKVNFIRDLSINVLPHLLIDNEKFDLIFIDGSHLRRDVIVDLVMSWKLVKPKGFIVMDDYNNKEGDVKSALHFWLDCLDKDEWVILFDRYQVIVQKLK